MVLSCVTCDDKHFINAVACNDPFSLTEERVLTYHHRKEAEET